MAEAMPFHGNGKIPILSQKAALRLRSGQASGWGNRGTAGASPIFEGRIS
jgi:hypothetical protein